MNKPLRAPTIFPATGSANPPLSSDLRHAPFCSGRRRSRELPTGYQLHGTWCRWVTPILHRWFASGLMALGCSHTKWGVWWRREFGGFLPPHLTERWDSHHWIGCHGISTMTARFFLRKKKPRLAWLLSFCLINYWKDDVTNKTLVVLSKYNL